MFIYTIKIVVIIIVFKQSAAILQMSFSTLSLSDLTFTDSIKYNINFILTDKAWERVKKIATKIIKKKTVRQNNRNDKDIMSKADKVSTLV